MIIKKTYFTFYLSFSLFYLFCPSVGAQPKNLVVERGQEVRIPPRLYQYDTIHIKENGVLKVNENGSRWLILQAKVIICDGLIEYTEFKRAVGSVTLSLENGVTLEHTYEEGLGGSGGNGSGNGRQQGGLGFSSEDLKGGGGGSGAYYIGRPHMNQPGIAATDFRGAPSPGGSNRSSGGQGARDPFGHGGLVGIFADKILFGPAAKINLRGSDGAGGTNGGSGDCYGGGQVYFYGGGGGGGGSSGGNGGVLIVKGKEIVNMPIVNVSPGKGGKGGLGGPSVRCHYHGQAGMTGDDGEQGYVDWL